MVVTKKKRSFSQPDVHPGNSRPALVALAPRAKPVYDLPPTV
jgi:hypothetical protein